MLSPADKFMPSKYCLIQVMWSYRAVFSWKPIVFYVCAVLIDFHIALHLEKCEEVTVMLMCLMLVDLPHLTHLDVPQTLQQILGKQRGNCGGGKVGWKCQWNYSLSLTSCFEVFR